MEFLLLQERNLLVRAFSFRVFFLRTNLFDSLKKKSLITLNKKPSTKNEHLSTKKASLYRLAFLVPPEGLVPLRFMIPPG